MNRRRLIIIAIIVGILAIVGVISYFILDVATVDTDETPGTLPEIGADFPESETVSTTTLAESLVPVQNVAAYRAFADGSAVIVHRDGVVSRYTAEASDILSSAPMANFASASFSADGAKALVLTGEQPRYQVNVFDVASSTWRVIPGTFRDAAWGPRGAQLVTLSPDATTNKTSVAIYDAATGRTVQTLVTLALGDVSVAWPGANTVIVSDKPSALGTGSSWAIDVPSKRVRLAARGKEGFTARWNGTASEAIALQANPVGAGGVTRLLSDGVERAQLSFVTIPDKCLFFSLAGSGNAITPYVACAVPRDQAQLQRSLLPDDWYRRAFVTDDVIVGVNLLTDDVDFTLAPPLPVDMAELQIVGSTFYYVDRASGRLYKSAL